MDVVRWMVDDDGLRMVDDVCCWMMDEDGRLYYDPNEGVPPEYVRVGGGF